MKITETIGVIVTDDNSNQIITENYTNEITVNFASEQIVDVPMGATEQEVALPTAEVQVIFLTVSNPITLKLNATDESPITINSMMILNTANVTALYITNPNSVAVKLRILLG